MELRVLKYFLAVTREENISNAAEHLHLTQPTLSRQLKELEDEFGKQLFIRGSRKITLTEDGMLLRKRAEEIIELAEKTIEEITNSNENISGNIVIGCGELDDNRLIFRTIKQLQLQYPNIHININSGDRNDILDKLDKGLYDFAILMHEIDKVKYKYIELPSNVSWGIICRKDSPLSSKENLDLDDLKDLPLIVSRQMLEDVEENKFKDYNIIATYNLAFNASLMVDEKIGYALTIDKLVNTSESSNLCFIPLNQEITHKIYIIWKKYQVFSKAAEKFLEQINVSLNEKKE